MYVAICDDNEEFVMELEKNIKDLKCHNLEYDAFYSGEELVDAYRDRSVVYDVIFLDMEMGGLSGIETANLIRRKDKNVIIVFVSSYKKYMQECFECSPLQFLVKPFGKKEFRKVFDKVCERLDSIPKVIVFAETKEKIRIYCRDVIYFRCSGHTMYFLTTDGKIHKTRKSMSVLLDNIKDGGFVQIYRSIAVNLEYIHRITDNSVEMYGCEETLPLGDTYKKNLHREFMQYRERKFVL